MENKVTIKTKSTGDRFTYLDLFSGCGGFSLGLEQAGLIGRAAIDFNESAVETLRKNQPGIEHVLCRDLTKFGPADLDELLKGERIDVIVGGPPCQGFSHARQVDGANHGARLIDDPRRTLYREFLRFVAYYQPRIFVMENVLGIRSAAGGEFFTRVQAEARELGYRVHPELVQAWRYGVPQKRVRQLIIGTRRELPLFVGHRYLRPTHADSGETGPSKLASPVTLWEAIGDLPTLKVNSGKHDCAYDLTRRALHIGRYGNHYLRSVLEVHRSERLLGHVSRPHSERDLRDFERLREGEHSASAIARGEQMEFPYDRENFKDRFTRQHRHQLCSTIVAHLSKDGLMFIHPTQNRSLTPREAARIQSFPDWYEFPEARTRSFTLIGNAVPPLVGRSVGNGVISYLKDAQAFASLKQRDAHLVPDSIETALSELLRVVDRTSPRQMRVTHRDDFLRGWFALAFIHSHLHPDSADDHGQQVEGDVDTTSRAATLFSPIYQRSGWPVALVPLVKEARRRLSDGEITIDEYYCSAAFVAGAALLK